MTDAEAIRFYGAQTVALARTLPITDMLNFLHGALAVAGEHPAIEPIREVYVRLAAADAQLELIASGQLELPFDGGKS